MTATLLAPSPLAQLTKRAKDALNRHANAHGGKGTAADLDATRLRLAVMTGHADAIHDTLHDVRLSLGDFCCYCREDLGDDGGDGEDTRYCSDRCGRADNVDPGDYADARY